MRALAAALVGGFTRAVGLLADCTGRIVVSGMGKSGHIARKTAANLRLHWGGGAVRAPGGGVAW